MLRDELMKLHTAFEVAKFSNQRAIDKIKAGQLPGPELSTAKLALTQNMTAAAEFVSPGARRHGSRRTPASGARSPGPSSCWACPACASPVGRTR